MIPLLILSLFGSGYIGEPDKMEKIDLHDWKTFEKDNYSIQYPSNWELNLQEIMGISFYLMAPLESKDDKFRENVNLIIENLTGYDIDLNAYVELSTRKLETLITNFKSIDNKKMKSGSNEYQRFEYTGEQGIYKLHFVQCVWVKDNKAFILSLTAEQSKFPDYKDISEAILSSFVLN